MRIRGRFRFLFYFLIFIFYCSDESSITNESRVILPLLSHGNTILSASTSHLPADGKSSCIITVTPKDSRRIVLGEGLSINFETTHGIFIDEIIYDPETGEYSQVLQSVENDTGTAVISVFIINRHLFKTLNIDFYLGIYFVNKNLGNIVRYHLNKKSGAIYQEDLDKLLELNANKVDLFEISEIIYCRNLERISLINCKIGYIPKITELNSLNTLNLRRNNIISIVPLEDLSTLDSLDISFNQITDISSLSNLTNLKSLSFDSNKVDLISGLNSLSNLNHLSIKNNRIDDLNPISNLNKITQLDVSDNYIEDINPITTLTELKKLDFANNYLINIFGIENLRNLEVLDLSSNYLRNISPLEHMQNLKYLNLNNNNISDILPLSKNPYIDNNDLLFIKSNLLNNESITNHIPVLMERGVKVYFLPDNFEQVLRSNMGYFSGYIDNRLLAQIETLQASHITLWDHTGLTLCSNLKDVSLTYCEINSVKRFSNLKSLESLNLNVNIISSLLGLENLVNLKKLCLSANRISDINHLANLTELTNLDLSYNDISNISPLMNNVYLDSLNLRANEIISIETLKYLTNIKYLDLRNNDIIDIFSLTENPGLGAGDVIYLNQNPLNDESKNSYIPALLQKGVTVYY